MNYQQLKKIIGFYSRFTASFTQVGYRWRRLSWPQFTPDYRGQHWLVTGGSGGIGAEVCRALAAEGCRVAVHYHTAAAAAGELAQALGGVALPADLRREEEADRLVPEAVAALGRLDVCVASAGIWPSDARRPRSPLRPRW